VIARGRACALAGGIGGLLAAAAPSGCREEPTCLTCHDPESSGAIESVELAELSGVAASGRHADVLYAHNDSGDSARLFALAATGEHLAIYELTGADHQDWEDIAQAPCASGQCLYVGDIGDNALDRSSYAIYVVSEPDAIAPGIYPLAAERVLFRYPDGPHDAETLLVHPQTGAVTIVTKAERGPASIYELTALTTDEVLTATLVGELDPREGNASLTGGAVHPDATGVLLRTNARLFHWPMAPDQTVAEALAGPGCSLPSADENQGEAVTWLDNAIVTIGEGAKAPINISECGGS
jgi:hypothetical protein